MLLDDSLLAVALARDVETEAHDGMPPTWALMDILPESKPALDDIVCFINQRWAHLRRDR